MSVSRFLFAAFLLVFSSLIFCSCGGGTEAGNPSVASGLTPAGAPVGLASVEIVNSICNKLTQCNTSLTLSDCTTGVEEQTNLNTAFGVSANVGDFSHVIQAETTGALRADPSRTQTCLSDIQAQACASAPVSGAYSASAPTSFTSVINMIPTSGTSCAGVF